MASPSDKYTTLISKLARGETPIAKPEELESLLHWLAERGNVGAQQIHRAFEIAGVDTTRARRLTLIYLDNTLFSGASNDPYRLFGLSPDCDFSNIRSVHKRLLQIFHPDKHKLDKPWFTERTERINKAYEIIKEYHGKPGGRPVATKVSSGMAAPVKTTSSGAQSLSLWGYFSDKTQLRRVLNDISGGSNKLQSRIYIILLAVPILFLLTIVLGSYFQGPRHGALVKSTSTEIELSQQNNETQNPSSQDQEVADNSNVMETKLTEFEEEESIQSEAVEEIETPSGSSRVNSNELTLTDDIVLEYEKSSDISIVDQFTDVGLGTSVSDISGNEYVSSEWTVVENPESDAGDQDLADEQSSLSINENAKQEWVQKQQDEADETESLGRVQTTQKTTSTKRVLETTVNISAIQNVLDIYEKTYINSDIEGFIGIFQPQARVDNIDNRSEIRDAYAEFFASTNQRKFIFANPSIQLLGSQRFQVNVDYAAFWAFINGESDTDSGKAKIQLVTDGDRMMIEWVEFTGRTMGVSNIKSIAEPAALITATQNQFVSDEAESNKVNDAEKRESASSVNTTQDNLTQTDNTTVESEHIESAVKSLLEKYKQFYNGSDIDQFSNLFQQDAKTKHAKGKPEIAQKYGEFFQKTRNREVSFKDIRIRSIGDRQLQVNTWYVASWVNSKNNKRTSRGRMKLSLVRIGDELKIWRLNY